MLGRAMTDMNDAFRPLLPSSYRVWKQQHQLYGERATPAPQPPPQSSSPRKVKQCKRGVGCGDSLFLDRKDRCWRCSNCRGVFWGAQPDDPVVQEDGDDESDVEKEQEQKQSVACECHSRAAERDEELKEIKQVMLGFAVFIFFIILFMKR
jgi:hypothetical protein